MVMDPESLFLPGNSVQHRDDHFGVDIQNNGGLHRHLCFLDEFTLSPLGDKALVEPLY